MPLIATRNITNLLSVLSPRRVPVENSTMVKVNVAPLSPSPLLAPRQTTVIALSNTGVDNSYQDLFVTMAPSKGNCTIAAPLATWRARCCSSAKPPMEFDDG